jgi:hypothetical protein
MAAVVLEYNCGGSFDWQAEQLGAPRYSSILDYGSTSMTSRKDQSSCFIMVCLKFYCQ